VIGSVRRLFELLNLCLEILEVLFFPLPESSLGSSVLRLAFLDPALVVFSVNLKDKTYCCGLRC
jgi:hypothetical protein